MAKGQWRYQGWHNKYQSNGEGILVTLKSLYYISLYLTILTGDFNMRDMDCVQANIDPRDDKLADFRMNLCVPFHMFQALGDKEYTYWHYHMSSMIYCSLKNHQKILTYSFQCLLFILGLISTYPCHTNMYPYSAEILHILVCYILHCQLRNHEIFDT